MAHLTRCEREREHCGDGDDAHYYVVIGLLVGDVSWAIEPAAARARAPRASGTSEGTSGKPRGAVLYLAVDRCNPHHVESLKHA